MTLQERFLFLFSDYRELLSREQSANEEARRWQRLYEESQVSLKQAQESALERERDITDRMMGLRYGSRALNAEATPAGPQETTDVMTLHLWKANKQKQFMQALDKRRAELLNGQPHSTTH